MANKKQPEKRTTKKMAAEGLLEAAAHTVGSIAGNIAKAVGISGTTAAPAETPTKKRATKKKAATRSPKTAEKSKPKAKAGRPATKKR